MIKDGHATERIGATDEGRLVGDGHVDAAFLRYVPGDKVSDADAKALKEGTKPEDKEADKPANKSGSGVTIKRG